MRLIDADESERLLDAWDWQDTYLTVRFKEMILDECPTVDPVHAAGACYCRECKWFVTTKGGGWCGEVMARPMPPDGFCSYRKRKDGLMEHCKHELAPCKYYYDDDWGKKGRVIFDDASTPLGALCYCKKCGALFIEPRVSEKQVEDKDD
jgi:hypothetical protein